MKAVVLAIMASLIAGCITVQPEVNVTKPWENHYMTVEEFKKGTESIQLGRDESIWVMSNKTLSRLLKNYMSNGKTR